MADWLTDVASVLDSLEEILEGLGGDGHLLLYARDLTRLVAWVRTQPRNRVLVLGALGAVGAVLLGTHRQRSRANLPVVESEGWEDPA